MTWLNWTLSVIWLTVRNLYKLIFFNIHHNFSVNLLVLQIEQMHSLKVPSKMRTPNRLIISTIVLFSTCMIYLLLSFVILPSKNLSHISTSLKKYSSSTSLSHIVFAISSSEKSWSTTRDYVRLWWRSKEMKGCVFLDKKPRESRFDQTAGNSLPDICISSDTSQFRYTYRNGPLWAIRVARMVSEIVAQNHSNVRWFVFGDDYTIFFPYNLVKTLSKYDHGLWYYVGTNSESYAQNKMFSFNMAFAGAGFAISYPLAKVLGKVLDSCLHRYPHLYGSDSRIHACIGELGISLTQEPGFHQMDIRGSIYGMLASHPLSPLVSLHLSEMTDPIFPNMTTLQSMQHLFQFVATDPQRVMQQTVCYDRWFSWTISVSWGYAVHIFPHHVLLPDALRTLETYAPLIGKGGMNEFYNVDSMVYDHDHPCRTPPVFFVYKLSSEKNRVRTSYRMTGNENCTFDTTSPRRIQEIIVFSQKLNLDSRKLVAPRRQCCDVLRSSTGEKMEIDIRECGDDELIHMHS